MRAVTQLSLFTGPEGSDLTHRWTPRALPPMKSAEPPPPAESGTDAAVPKKPSLRSGKRTPADVVDSTLDQIGNQFHNGAHEIDRWRLYAV